MLAKPKPKPKPNPNQVTATSDDVVLMSLDRATFTSLLGSLQAILNREAAKRHKEAEKARLTLHLYPTPISYPYILPYILTL